MFDPADTPRVFYEAPGADFARAVAAGLRDRLAHAPPEAMARVLLLVNTGRMARQVTQAFQQGGASFLPRIRLVTDLRAETLRDALPTPGGDLAQRLALVRIVQGLIDSGAPFVPALPAFDLADSLTALLSEMAAEGIAPEALDTLDVTDESGHWQHALEFLRIVRQYRDDIGLPPGREAAQRQAIEALVARWQDTPPATPVIVAGSTGSRGATSLLMQAVARLPQGALILPGFDDAMPARGWDDLTDALTGEDHPQFRYARLMTTIGIGPRDLAQWSATPAPVPARNAAISLALRPAPVTDCWLAEGPDLPDLSDAFAAVTLVEAPTRRAEALTIATRLCAAAHAGQTAALVTPDRLLAREVTSALDRWNILPDDSAGMPLHLTPPGRFALHVSTLFQQEITNTALFELLKHPLTNTGEASAVPRADHLLLTRDLELWMRRRGVPHPNRETLLSWAAEDKRATALPWAEWIAATITTPPEDPADTALDIAMSRRLARAESIAAGPGTAGSGALWAKKAGVQTEATLREIVIEGATVTRIAARDVTSLIHSLLSAQQLRRLEDPYPGIAFIGPQEMRTQTFDVVILGGLTEGIWPAAPPADPWLNRTMRHAAGLLLPERRIGLSAHDFQQAAAAPEVWLTRARRSDDAETVPSRWLNRLTNLLRGLPQRGGDRALEQMAQRGAGWLARAAELDRAPDPQPMPRPAPRPPVEHRPRELAVTRIGTLVRDPYAIYARYILRLRPLDPLDRAPDALLRGIVVHEALEHFIKAVDAGTATLTRDDFLAHVRHHLDAAVPWPAIHALWMARMARIADWFITREADRRLTARPLKHEAQGIATLDTPPFTLTGRADRIDVQDDGRWHIYDYKTGNPPSDKQQQVFDKQLPLLAAIAELGSYQDIGSGRVAGAHYIGLGTNPKETSAPLDKQPVPDIWDEFRALIAAFDDRATGYAPRRRTVTDRDHSDYDHLSRLGEWDPTDDPRPEDVG